MTVQSTTRSTCGNRLENIVEPDAAILEWTLRATLYRRERHDLVQGTGDILLVVHAGLMLVGSAEVRRPDSSSVIHWRFSAMEKSTVLSESHDIPLVLCDVVCDVLSDADGPPQCWQFTTAAHVPPVELRPTATAPRTMAQNDEDTEVDDDVDEDDDDEEDDEDGDDEAGGDDEA
jgi:hypothetical protein